MAKLFGAIDLGASSGRVMAGWVGDGQITLTQVHRFANGPVEHGDRLHWNFTELCAQIQLGLTALGEFASGLGLPVTSIGVDTWAVDYGLLDTDGELLAEPRHYRDERNLLGVELVNQLVSPERQFAANGLQFQPFNTIYQLAAERAQNPELFARASKVVLIPDLIGHWLTGKVVTEVTNASTTGLLDANTHEWNAELFATLGYSTDWFGPLVQPGESLGGLLPERITHPALKDAVVTAVASHDTASAVVGAPLTDAGSAYLSSGTWSLLGLELEAPVLSAAARSQNFTNELGKDHKIRFLKNLSGLWLMQQSLATWEAQGTPQDLQDLLSSAANVSSSSRIDVTDPEFVQPGDMPARIKMHCHRHGQPVPETPAEITRCVLDSLADAYASAVRAFEQVTGKTISQLNIVGGGSENALLCQLTANTTGLTVLAGPVEATALGNIVTQAGVHGAAPANLREQRELIAQAFKLKQYQPQHP